MVFFSCVCFRIVEDPAGPPPSAAPRSVAWCTTTYTYTYVRTAAAHAGRQDTEGPRRGTAAVASGPAAPTCRRVVPVPRRPHAHFTSTYIGRSKQHVRIVTIKDPASRPVPGDPILIASTVRRRRARIQAAGRALPPSLVSHSFYVYTIKKPHVTGNPWLGKELYF